MRCKGLQNVEVGFGVFPVNVKGRSTIFYKLARRQNDLEFWRSCEADPERMVTILADLAAQKSTVQDNWEESQDSPLAACLAQANL